MNTHTATAATLIGLSLGLAAPAALANEAGTVNARGQAFLVSERVPQVAVSAPRSDDVLSTGRLRGPRAYTSYSAGRAVAPVLTAPRTRTMNAWGANFDVPAR